MRLPTLWGIMLGGRRVRRGYRPLYDWSELDNWHRENLFGNNWWQRILGKPVQAKLQGGWKNCRAIDAYRYEDQEISQVRIIVRRWFRCYQVPKLLVVLRNK